MKEALMLVLVLGVVVTVLGVVVTVVGVVVVVAGIMVAFVQLTVWKVNPPNSLFSPRA